MDKIVELIPNWSKEVFGFNQGTLVVLLGLVILVFKLRIISMMTIPKIFSSLCEKSPVAKQALQGSSKALGTAIGAAILWQGSAALSTSDVAMMPSYVGFWLPSLAQVVMLIAMMVWALRLTIIVQAVVEYWDDDDWGG